MTAIDAGTGAGPSSTSDGRPATAGGGIERVNAFDGLFLRAEHLDLMQDYARELATAVGAAGGPGVVEGYGVSLHDHLLEVRAGLAIDASGRPLRSYRTVVLDVDGLEQSDNEFYYVEVTRSEWDFGHEAVQGVLCADPCSGGGSAHPYTAEGVLVRLVRAAEPQLEAVLDSDRRSWLAGWLFAAERKAELGWPNRTNPRLLRQVWNPPDVVAGRPTGVRLAVLIPGGDAGWLVDVWTARRDRGDPPPVRAWQWRLGMRPWDVFVAQILQFQDLLGALLGDGSSLSRASYVDELLDVLGNVGEHVMKWNRSVTRDRLQDLVHAVRKGELGDESSVAKAYSTLPALGIKELPPAGFLPALGAGWGRQLENEITDFLGGDAVVDVRVCTGVPGDVGAMISRAQHRGRIPLTGGQRTPIDIMVPRQDGKDLFDWVVFARREEIDCGEQAAVEPVDVYVLDPDKDKELIADYETYISGQGKGPQPGVPTLATATLRYPVRGWALPNEPDYAGLVATLRAFGRTRGMTVVAIVTDDARRPLGLTRAALLAAHSTEQGTDAPQLVTFIGADEAIVVLSPSQVQ